MFLLVLVASVFGSSLGADLPSFLMRCSKNDPNIQECFERAANDAIPKLASGVPSLGIPPMDPLEIPKISIKQPGNNARLSMDLILENIKFYNVSKNSRVKTKVDLKNNVFSGTFFVPHVRMESDYMVDGKVLVVPVKGRGKARLDIFNSRAEFTSRLQPKTIKGMSYYNLDSLQYRIIGSENMKIRFNNLFGNRALGDSVNAVLNDNWRELYDSMVPSFSEVFRQYFTQLGKRVVNKVPVEQVFPERI